MTHKEKLSTVESIFSSSIELKSIILKNGLEIIVEMSDLCIASFLNKNKLLICGNGGSAADAQHLAAELLVRLRPHI